MNDDTNQKKFLAEQAELREKGKYQWHIVPAFGVCRAAAGHGLTTRPQRVIIREIDLGGAEMSIIAKKDLCFCGSGKNYHECHAEIADNTAMAYLFEAFKLIDEDIKNAEATPVCQKGCNECCRDYFEVSAAEFFAIFTHIQNKRFYNSVRLSRVRKCAATVLPYFPAFEPYSALSGKRLDVPCVFVDNRNGKCRIYEVRPLICRLYGYYPSAYKSVYWFGSPIFNAAGSKGGSKLEEYALFAEYSDFNDWFA